MATQLPPLPTDSNMTGANPSIGADGTGGGGGLAAPGSSSASGSPFAGGLGGMMQSITQIESGYKTLATMLPSLAPIAADAISKLRLAVPNAMGAMAGGPGGQGNPGGPGAQATSASPASPAASGSPGSLPVPPQ